MAGLITIIPPSANTWPVSLAQIKAYLRITNSDDDDTLTYLLSSACEFIENETRQQMLTATKILTLDDFPDNSPLIFNAASVLNIAPNLSRPTPTRFILIDTPPLQSVSSITYISSGATTTLDPSTYSVDITSRPGRVVLNIGQQWPKTDCVPGGVQITFVCGYGTPDQVPDRFKMAVRWLTGHYYENRDLGVGRNQTELPYGLRTVIEQLMFREAYAA